MSYCHRINMASSLPPATIHHHHRQHHRHRPHLLSANISTIPFTSYLAENYSTTHILSTSLLLPSSNIYPNSRWIGCCPATSPRSPPPPSDEGQFSDLPGKLSRIQDRVQIFFAVLFWMSLFFWSSVWDRKNNDKGPPFRR